MIEQAAKSRSSDKALWTDPLHYAVIDLAIAAELRADIEALPPAAAQTLFAQNASRKLLRVGPWLVRMSKAPDVERKLTQYGDTVPWGYFVHSTFDIISLRQSLRKFNVVSLAESQKDVLFRYWDPRVMRSFLDISTRRQRNKFFELIDEITIGARSFDVRN